MVFLPFYITCTFISLLPYKALNSLLSFRPLIVFKVPRKCSELLRDNSYQFSLTKYRPVFVLVTSY